MSSKVKAFEDIYFVLSRSDYDYFFLLFIDTGTATADRSTAAIAPAVTFPVVVPNQFIIGLKVLSPRCCATMLSLSAGIVGVIIGSGSAYSTL